MSSEKDKLVKQYPKYEKQIETSMSNKTLEKILVAIIAGVIYSSFIYFNPLDLSFLNNIGILGNAFITIKLISSFFFALGYIAIIALTNHLLGKYEKKHKSKWGI